MPISEETLASWAKGPGEIERLQCERAEKAVRDAVANDAGLKPLNVTVFLQGSYRNKTNVRQNSDVDICVKPKDVFFPFYPSGTDSSTFGNIAAKMPFQEYKALVGAALERHFGKAATTRGDKAFKVHENTYRIDADVVAVFEHRHYYLRADQTYEYLKGIGFDSDSGKRVINWPEQNYENSWTKHQETGHRYRKVVRMIKRLRDHMQAENITAAGGIASCLIEALVWNAPAGAFEMDAYRKDLREVLAHTFNGTLKDEDCSQWREVNAIKYLFRSSQPWTRQQAHLFLDAAWKRAGLE